MADKLRIWELLKLLVETHNKGKRREYAAALRELLRPVLEDKED